MHFRTWLLCSILILSILLTACANQPTVGADLEQIEPTQRPTPEVTLQAEVPLEIVDCDGTLTSADQEGPYFSPGSPERSSLIEGGMQGVPILITGKVLDQDCNPIAGAKVDLWLADVNGQYDNVGYRLRGHTYSNEAGEYAIESIETGLYTGRPPHIHVKVFDADGVELLTTQMYFPGSEGSQDIQDAPDLYVTYIEPDENGRKRVIFNFVVQR